MEQLRTSKSMSRQELKAAVTFLERRLEEILSENKAFFGKKKKSICNQYGYFTYVAVENQKIIGFDYDKERLERKYRNRNVFITSCEKYDKELEFNPFMYH